MNINANVQNSVKAQSILGFIPALVFQHILDNQEKGIKPHVPEIQSFKSVIMFADICGFTNLTEQLSKIGPEGSEVIAFAINRYMELLIKAIAKSGGDIFKFAGDAIIVVWPPPQNEKQEQIKILLRQGIQSALEIQAKLNDTFILENIKLSVKIGFGVGDISILYVGGVFNRSEFLATGEALLQAFESEHCATQGGQIIISKKVHEMVGNYYNCQKITKEYKDFYYVLSNSGPKVKNISNALLIKNEISLKSFDSIKTQLIRYIPAALQQYIYVDQERWSSELRVLTVMFVNLSIDLAKALTQDGLNHIQQVIETVQKSVYAFQGSLNKILMDDKGSTLIIVFGLPPMAKQDDPARAVITALTMKKELNKINCVCKIGISTGCTFAGVVGTSGSRREYSIIGDSVNLSARLMQVACKSDEEQSIILDLETAKEASQKMKIIYYKSINVKGKAEKVSIYYPANNLELFKIQIHNPFFPKLLDDFKFEHKYKDKIKNYIDSFLNKDNKSNYLLRIHGNKGTGKSHLIKLLIGYYERNNQQIFQIRLCSFLQKEQQFLYSIRIFLQQILKQISILLNKQYNKELLNDIFEDQAEKDFINFIEFETPSQIQLFDRAINKQSEGLNYTDISNLKEYIDIILTKYRKLEKQKIIIAIDDGHNIEEDSFKILKHIIKHNKQIMLIFIHRNDYFEQIVNLDQIIVQQQLIEEEIQSIEQHLEDNCSLSLEFKNLKKDQLQPILADLFLLYKMRLEKDIIVDIVPNQQFKNPFHYEYIKNQLINFDIQEFFLQTMFRKTEGNPLTFITLVDKFLVENLLVRDTGDQDVIITQKLFNTLNLDEFIIIQAPLDKLRLNSQLLDKIGCLELLVLKVASLIGDIFDVQTLNKMQSFKQIIYKENLIKILQSLENQDLIETMELNQLNKYYRFTKPFLREITYQRLLYTQRRELHKSNAEALQEIPSQFEIDERVEAQRLEHNWILAEQKWNTQKITSNKGLELSHKAKRSIIIKSIQSKLISKTQTIKQGILKKKSDKNVTWAERYCVMTQKELKYYYTEAQYLKTPSNPLAIIMLSTIYQIMPLNDKEKVNQRFAFEIRAGNWYKRQKLMQRRDFYFSANTDEILEEWTIYIEFMRVKATYDEFVNNFGKIQFPLANFKEFYDMSLGTELNNYQKLSQKKQIIPNNNSVNLLKSQKRNTVLTISSFLQRSSQEQEQNIKEIKRMIKKFLNQSQLLLFSHLFERSIKINQNKLGSDTKVMLKYQDILNKTIISQTSQQQQQIETSIQTEDSPLSRSRASVKIDNFQLETIKNQQLIISKQKKITNDQLKKRSKSSEFLISLKIQSQDGQQSESYDDNKKVFINNIYEDQL